MAITKTIILPTMEIIESAQDISHRELDAYASTATRTLPVGVIVGITIACSAIFFTALTCLIIRYEVVFRKRRELSRGVDASDANRITPTRAIGKLSYTPSSSQPRKSRAESSSHNQFDMNSSRLRSNFPFGWKMPWSQTLGKSVSSTVGKSPSLGKNSASNHERHAAVTSFESPSERRRVLNTNQDMSIFESPSESLAATYRRRNDALSHQAAFAPPDGLANCVALNWPASTGMISENVDRVFRAESVNSSVLHMFSTSSSGRTLPRSAGSMSANSAKNSAIESSEDRSPRRTARFRPQEMVGIRHAPSRSSSVIDPTLLFSMSGGAESRHVATRKGGGVHESTYSPMHIERKPIPEISPPMPYLGLNLSRWQDKSGSRTVSELEQSETQGPSTIVETEEEQLATDALHAPHPFTKALERHHSFQDPSVQIRRDYKELQGKSVSDLVDEHLKSSSEPNPTRSRRTSVASSSQHLQSHSTTSSGGEGIFSTRPAGYFAFPTRRSSAAFTKRQSPAPVAMKERKTSAPIAPISRLSDQTITILQSDMHPSLWNYDNNMSIICDEDNPSGVIPPLPLRLRTYRESSTVLNSPRSIENCGGDLRMNHDDERLVGDDINMGSLAIRSIFSTNPSSNDILSYNHLDFSRSFRFPELIRRALISDGQGIDEGIPPPDWHRISESDKGIRILNQPSALEWGKKNYNDTNQIAEDEGVGVVENGNGKSMKHVWSKHKRVGLKKVEKGLEGRDNWL